MTPMMRGQRGVTLVDVMAGLVVALLAMSVVYQSLVVVQTMRRNVAAAGDLQATGSLALSTLAIAVGNAGAGLASATRWLDTCPATADFATTFRPVHVLISDGGAADRPDTLFVRQSLARSSGVALPFTTDAPVGSTFRIGGIDGIATGDRVLAISRSGTCVSSSVTNVTNAGPGVLDVAHTPVDVALPVTSLLLNLGLATRASAARFDLVSGTLRSTDMSNGDAPNPLLSNLVNVKFQYGIDSDGDGTLDTWVSARPGPWEAATLLGAPRSTLERIKAVRIGLIARTDQPERERTAAFDWVLFDCELDDKSACPGRLAGTIPSPARGGYRYRTFETIVPLRNVVWNAGA
jgi:type IV pilus assembly protein PilW